MSPIKWQTFLRSSLLRRVPEEDFSTYAALLHEQEYLNGRKLSKLVFSYRNTICSPTDPIIPRYIRGLISRSIVSVIDVLSAVLEDWTPGRIGKDEARQSLATRLEADSLIVQELAVRAATRAQTSADSRSCFIGCSKLLAAIVPHVGKSNEGKEGEAVSLDPALSMVEATCLLFATSSTTEAGVSVFLDRRDKELRTEVTRLFVIAAPYLPMMSLELRQRLDEVQKGYSFSEQPEKKVPDQTPKTAPPDVAQFEMSVLDADNLHSRASLYVYLNAALSGAPRLDDMALMGFLMSRYNGDFVNMTIHLILAAFDVLANGVHRSEPAQTMDVYHCFISNKLPLLLSYVSKSAMEQIPLDACITQAYSRIDTTVFPAFSSTFDLSNRDAPFADVRQEFLFACALHSLVPESSIENLLGESSMMTLPSHGQYNKHSLIQQIASNPKKAEQLIEELELFEGNAGIIAGAVVDVIQRLCRDNETMTLKRICLHIVRKPRRLDVIALFHNPSSYLQPLCNVLDGWKWDEDQGESQPVYDEFGSILLLILTASYRYGLIPSDLGITDADSFVLRLLGNSSQEHTLDQLDDTTKQHLGSWISALFIAEGLSDELTSSCSPQDFYLLVPTLFSQSLDACSAGKLTIDALRSGFEYLLEGFLLPSLLVALLWLSNHIRSEETSPKSSLQLLHALIKPTTGSFEAREIHQTIVSIAADPVRQALQSSKVKSSSPDAQSIMKLLNSYNDFKRAPSVSRTELDVWCSTPGALSQTINHAFQVLVYWDTNQMNTTPPGFTFKLFTVSIRLHGVIRALQFFLESLKMQHESGNFDFALDVLFAIISAPSSASSHQQQQVTTLTSRFALQDAVRLEHNNLSRYLESGDNITAEALVRLNRRLDNLALVVPPPPLDDTMDAAAAAVVGPLPDDLANIDLGHISMDTDTDGSALNVSMGGAGDSGIHGANATSTTDPNSNKDLIDQILDSSNSNNGNSTTGPGGQQQQQQQEGNSNPSNDMGFPDLGSMGADDMMFDLDSANLGLGSDFDLEMDGMF